MKNNKKFIEIIFCSIGIMFIICCIFSVISYADNTGIVVLESKQDIVNKEEEIEITVSLNNNKTAAFNFFLYFDESKLEYIEGPENTNKINNCVIFVWYDTKGGSEAKEGEIGSFKFKAKKEGNVTFSLQGEFYSEIGQLIQTEVKEKQIRIGNDITNLQKQEEKEYGKNTQNDNASLQVLRLNKEGLIPTFEKNVHEYYLTVENDIKEIEVLAISENPNSTVEILGNTNLKEGLNFVTVRVISADKTQNNLYTIQITRTADVELANTNLEVLAIQEVLLNPPFDNREINYNVEISNKIDKINLLAVPENEQASVIVEGNENLVEGNNFINVIVTAPNGFTKKKYKVEVYKRNEEEENKYQEEQDKQKEMLEEAYKVENLKAEEELEETTRNDSSSLKVFGIIILNVVLILIVVFLYNKYKK